MPSIAPSFVAAKRSFSRRFAWSRRHKFSYLRNFDRSWSSPAIFWCRQRAVWAISGSRHQPRSRRRSVSCDRVNVNKPKLWNFDRPLGLPGHFQWIFLRRQGVISSTYDGAGAWQLPLPSAAEQRSRSHRRKCGRYTRYLRNFDEPLGVYGRRRRCFWRRQRVISSKNEVASPDNFRCRQSWSMSPPSVLHVHFAVYLA